MKKIFSIISCLAFLVNFVNHSDGVEGITHADHEQSIQFVGPIHNGDGTLNHNCKQVMCASADGGHDLIMGTLNPGQFHNAIASLTVSDSDEGYNAELDFKKEKREQHVLAKLKHIYDLSGQHTRNQMKSIFNGNFFGDVIDYPFDSANWGPADFAKFKGIYVRTNNINGVESPASGYIICIVYEGSINMLYEEINTNSN